MASIICRKDWGQGYGEYTTEDSATIHNRKRDVHGPQELFWFPTTLQGYSNLARQDLDGSCALCGLSDASFATSESLRNDMAAMRLGPTKRMHHEPTRRPEFWQERTSPQYPQITPNEPNHWRRYSEDLSDSSSGSPVETPLDDSLYFDQVERFIARQRALIADGWPIESVFGKETVNLQAFFAPEEQSIEPVTVADWVVHATREPDTLGVPERLGFMLLGALMLRWRIAPTAQNYMMLPAFMRPTSTQLAVPHNAWIDFLPWPEVRDAMILSPNEYVKIAQNRMYLFGLISANWKQSPANIIAPSKHDDRIVLSFAFQHHVCNGSNWTIDAEAVAFSSVFASRTRI